MKTTLLNTVKSVAIVIGMTVALGSTTAMASCPSATGDAHANPMKLQSSSSNSRNGPEMDIIQVEHDEDLSKLAAIGIRFRSTSETDIDYNSVRFLYGMFKIDITDRIKECFDLSEDILVTGSVLPAGTHTLRIEVADARARTSEFKIKVQVL